MGANRRVMTEGKRPVGRPTMYQDDFPDRARTSMASGFSKFATAGSLGVSKQTFDTWCHAHPEFLAAVKEGETMRTLKLEADLLAAPDGPTVTSRIFALKNAAPEEWRDRQMHEMTGKDGGPIKTEDVTPVDLARRIAFALAQGMENKDG